VLQTKGQYNEQNRAKRAAFDEWCKAVSAQGGFGRWCWAVSQNPADIKDILVGLNFGFAK